MNSLLNKALLCLSLLTILNAGLPLAADPSWAGNVITIDSSGGINAIRNPALMSRQKNDSAGLYMVYTSLADFSVDGSIDMGDIYENETFSSGKDEIYNAMVLFSIIGQWGDHSYGFGIKRPEDEQFAKSENDISFGYYAPASLTDVKADIDETKTENNVTAVFSYSYRLNINESLGFQVEYGRGKTEKNKEITTSVNGAVYSGIDLEYSTDREQYAFSFGYSGTNGIVEAGLMLRSGDFVKEETDLSYSSTGGSPGETGISEYMFRRKGPEAILGIGINALPGMMLLLEARYMMPHEYEIKEYDDFSQLVHETDVEIDKSAGIRGGIEYRFCRYFSAGAGGSYNITESIKRNSIGKVTAHEKIVLSELTAGLDIYLSRDITIVIGCDMIFLSLKNRSSNTTPALDMDVDLIYVNYIAGAALYF